MSIIVNDPLRNIDEHVLQRKGLIHLSVSSVGVSGVMFFSMMADIILHVSAVSFFTLMFGYVNIKICISIKIFDNVIV